MRIPPYRRPSAGVAQGVSGQDGRARHSRAREGPSMPAPGVTPERGKSGRAAGRPGCRGALSLWLLSLCAGKEKVTRPGGRNPGVSNRSAMSPAPSSLCQAMPSPCLCGTRSVPGWVPTPERGHHRKPGASNHSAIGTAPSSLCQALPSLTLRDAERPRPGATQELGHHRTPGQRGHLAVTHHVGLCSPTYACGSPASAEPPLRTPYVIQRI